MGKPGPETKLVKKMRDAGKAKYGTRLVLVKYHGSQFGEAGVSDLLGTLDGVALAIEVKAPENYGNNPERALRDGPTLKQRLFVDRMLTAGACAGFAATVDQFMEVLAHADQGSIEGTGQACEGHNIIRKIEQEEEK